MTRVFKKPYNLVYIKCHEAAIKLNFDITKEDITDGEINFKVGMTLFSWGEKFIILITNAGEHHTRVEVSSAVTFQAQLIDWGKNNENIKDFFHELNKLLKT